MKKVPFYADPPTPDRMERAEAAHQVRWASQGGVAKFSERAEPTTEAGRVAVDTAVADADEHVREWWNRAVVAIEAQARQQAEQERDAALDALRLVLEHRDVVLRANPTSEITHCGPGVCLVMDDVAALVAPAAAEANAARLPAHQHEYLTASDGVQTWTCRDCVEPTRAAEQRSWDLLYDDLAELLRVLGLGDHARPYSPHQVMQEAIAKAARLREEGARAERERPEMAVVFDLARYALDVRDRAERAGWAMKVLPHEAQVRALLSDPGEDAG